MSQIEEKKSLIGGKVYFRFNGSDYKTRAEAEAAEAALGEQKVAQAARDAERDRLMKELQQRQADYATHPEYKHLTVTAQFADSNNRLYGIFNSKDTGLSGVIDNQVLAQRTSEACRDLYLEGYDVLSILDITSGIGMKGHSAAAGSFGLGTASRAL